MARQLYCQTVDPTHLQMREKSKHVRAAYKQRTHSCAFRSANQQSHSVWIVVWKNGGASNPTPPTKTRLLLSVKQINNNTKTRFLVIYSYPKPQPSYPVVNRHERMQQSVTEHDATPLQPLLQCHCERFQDGSLWSSKHSNAFRSARQINKNKVVVNLLSP